MSRKENSVLHEARTNTFRQLLIAVSIAYVGLPIIFYLFPHPDGDLSSTFQTILPSTTADDSQIPTQAPKAPLIRFFQDSGFSLATPFKFIWTIIVYFLSNAVSATRLVIPPLRQLFQLSENIALILVRPLWFILDPLSLAIRILLTPVIGPLYGLYMLLTAFYPIYVFCAASLICGAVAGLGAKWASILTTNTVVSMMEKESRAEK